tara:strand:+ start:7064 stop:8377 length:1314 start_codon:yes stop_codon:yes gene_type:complete
MSAKNDVICRDEIEKCKNSLRKDISLAVQEVDSLSSSLLLDDCLHTIGWSDSFRALLIGLKKSEPAYRNLILNSANHINSNCSMGIPLYLVLVEHLLKSEYDGERLLEDIQQPKRTKSATIISEWQKTVHDEYTIKNKDLFLSAVNQAGSLGSVVVEKTSAINRVEVDCGSKFSCTAHSFFDDESLDIIEFDKCLIAVVDGAIIEVSEIHHLLTYAYERSMPAVIVASNYSDDVANTLRVNWEKGLVKVLPLILNRDLDNINQVKDICEVACTVPISKDTGLLLSAMDFDEQPLNSVVYIRRKSEISIKTTKRNFDAIRVLQKEIQESLEKEKVDDIKKILRKRLSRLSTRKAIVKINCSQTELGILQDRAGSLFQLLSCAGREGVVSLDPIYERIGYSPSRYMPRILPRRVTEISIRRAISDVRAINKIMAIIKLD